MTEVLTDNPEGVLLPDSNVFWSLKDAPFDVWDGNDGDDSVHAPGVKLTEVKTRALQSVHIGTTNTNRVVVFPRTIQKGDQGFDVTALKRALSRAGFRKWDLKTNKFGELLRRNLQRFQSANLLKADGVYGPETHNKLKRFYDQYGASLMLKEQALLDPRNIIVSAATFGYNNRGAIHYTQGALRMYGVRNRIVPPQIPSYEDCSSFATWCYWVAKVPDPNGLGYNGQGYTGTLANHGVRVSRPRAADLNLYGSGSPFHHVSIAIDSERCISHGSEIGPLLLPIHYRGDYYYTRSYLK